MLRLLRIWPSLGGSCASLESLDLSVFGSLGRHKNPLERAQILNSPRWGVIISHYYMAELILLKSNWAAQNHDTLPLSFLLPLGRLKKFGPRGPNFLSRLPLSLPAPSGAAQEVWPSRAKLLEPSAPLPPRSLWSGSRSLAL